MDDTPCSGSDIRLEVVVPNQTRYLSLIGNLAEQVVNAMEGYCGDRDALAYHLNLVLTEAMVNAIEHSGAGDKPTPVRVCIWVDENNIIIRVHDQGCGFDLETVPTPDFENLHERGRGIYIIRALMDGVDYVKTDHGNVLEMRKRLA